jgi:hypothetical protein
MPLIGLQAAHLQILGQVVVNTRGVFTSNARQAGDGAAMGGRQLRGFLEAVSTRDMLHDVPYLLMGELHVP